MKPQLQMLEPVNFVCLIVLAAHSNVYFGSDQAVYVTAANPSHVWVLQKPGISPPLTDKAEVSLLHSECAFAKEVLHESQK